MSRKLFLVDGSNQAFRAFFAIQSDMRSPEGAPTRALYGFVATMQRLLREHKPDYIAVVFDRGLSFRNALYPDYKGQRPDMPADLRAQWPDFIPLCEDLGLSAMATEGFEADDIIGTLAVRHASPDLHVSIVSSDKDFAQLVTENVSLLDVAKGKHYGPAEVLERWGVGPERIIDLLTLMGDTSDNVPGVPGVGPKRASAFVQKFGSAEEVVAAAGRGEIGGKTGEKVAASGDVVALARKLVTIHLDAPVPDTLDALTTREPAWPALVERYKRYGFRRLLAEAQEAAGGAVAAPSDVPKVQYTLATTPAELDALMAALRAAGRFAFDTETTSLNPIDAQLVGMSFCWSAEEAVYVPVAHTEGPNCADALERMRPILENPHIQKIGQNLKYDMRVLDTLGVELRGVTGDTMIADYLLQVDQRHGLDDLARRHLDHQMIAYKDVTKDTGGSFADVAVGDALEYAAEDAHIAWLLDDGFDLSPVRLLHDDVEVPLIRVLADMEQAGIAVDVAALEALSVELGGRISEIVTAVHAEAGREFNLNSTQQLGAILFDERGLKPVKKTRKGSVRSTDAATLQALSAQGDTLAALVLDYRALAKLKSTYVDALPQHVNPTTGRIHSSFHQAVAATGRLASNDPNLQNIPIRTAEGRRIRGCFVARPGHLFLSADYSQIELRVLAHFCGEGPLVDAFLSGEDIHRRTAAEVFGIAPPLVSGDQRRAAKAINFGIVYGMSAFRLANELGIGRRVAQQYIDDYFARYPQVARFLDQAKADALETGVATTLMGRRRPVRGLDARNPNERGAAERIAINTPVQGSAADVIKLAMIRVWRRLRDDFPATRLILQVHDELVLEVPEADLEPVRRAVCWEMQNVLDLAVPLVVDTGDGKTWDAAH